MSHLFQLCMTNLENSGTRGAAIALTETGTDVKRYTCGLLSKNEADR